MANPDHIQEPPPALFDRVAAGDESALAELYRHYGARVYTLALRMLGSRDAAQDILQDVFVALPGALPQYRGDAPFWAWLRRVAVNRVLMQLRAERSRPQLVSWSGDAGGADWPDTVAAGAAERLLLARDLDAALARLAPTSRAVVWLHDVEGWTHPEIAAAMDRSVSFSKTQLARAHLRLRELLQPLEPNRRMTEEIDEDASESGTAARSA
jgi:RNA polymerase sigma factor (sigma-70 family)